MTQMTDKDVEIFMNGIKKINEEIKQGLTLASINFENQEQFSVFLNVEQEQFSIPLNVENKEILHIFGNGKTETN